MIAHRNGGGFIIKLSYGVGKKVSFLGGGGEAFCLCWEDQVGYIVPGLCLAQLLFSLSSLESETDNTP